MSGGPIFIVGAMGSGTTLLRLVLDSHPRIAIPRETGFMRAYKAHRFSPFKYSGRDWTRRLGWEHDEFLELMRGFYDQLFMRYAEQHGKVRWGEKTPSHTWHIDDMAELFPDARFIGMVRHPLGSSASNMSRFGQPLWKAGWHWTRYAREIARQAARYPDRMVVLHYEDLVLRPEPTIRELLEWLGEPWSDEVLEHHEIQGGRGGPKKVEGATRPDDPIDESRVDKWTRTMDAEHREWLAERFAELGRFWGYDIDDANARTVIGAPDRLLVHGAEIDARIDEFHELDIRTQVEVTPYEGLYDPRDLMIVEREVYNELVRPRGLRRASVGAVRLLPETPRKALIRGVRRTRKKLSGRARRRGSLRLRER